MNDSTLSPLRPRDLMQRLHYADDLWLAIKVTGEYEEIESSWMSALAEIGSQHRLKLSPSRSRKVSGQAIKCWEVSLANGGRAFGQLFGNKADSITSWLTFHTTEDYVEGFRKLLPMAEFVANHSDVVFPSESATAIWGAWRSRKSPWELPPYFVNQSAPWMTFDQTISIQDVQASSNIAREDKASIEHMTDRLIQQARAVGFMSTKRRRAEGLGCEARRFELHRRVPDKPYPIFHGQAYVLVRPHSPIDMRITIEARGYEYFPSLLPLLDIIYFSGGRIADHHPQAFLDLQEFRQQQAGSLSTIKKPERDAPLEDWFDYYHRCRRGKIKVTLKDIATAVGHANGYIRQKHLIYKHARGL